MKIYIVMGWNRPPHGFITCACWLLWMITRCGCLSRPMPRLSTPRIVDLILGKCMYLAGSLPSVILRHTETQIWTHRHRATDIQTFIFILFTSPVSRQYNACLAQDAHSLILILDLIYCLDLLPHYCYALSSPLYCCCCPFFFFVSWPSQDHHNI